MDVVQVERVGVVAILHLAGEFGSCRHQELEELAKAIVAGSASVSPRLLLDCARTSTFGARLIGILAECQAAIEQQQRRMALCHVSPRLQEVLKASGLTNWLNVFDHRERAFKFLVGHW